MFENTSPDPLRQSPTTGIPPNTPVVSPVVTPPAPAPTVTPQVVVGGAGMPPTVLPSPPQDTSPSSLARIHQAVMGGRPWLFWVVAGVSSVMVVTGVSFYLFSRHDQSPREQTAVNTTAEESSGSPRPTDTNPNTQDKPAAPDTNNHQSGTGTNNTINKTPKNIKVGGGTGGSGSTGGSGGTGGTGGNDGGGTGGSGGNTPPGPIALKIMPLGDSLTQGGVGSTQTVNGYRLQLWNNLGSAYQIDYVGTWQNGNSQLPDKDLNGFSGACIKHSPCGGGTLYPQTAGWITATDPDLVIMQGGGNDFSDHTMTETKVQTYMEDWINLVFATKPSVKIIVSGPAQWYPNYAASLEAYVNQLKAAGKPIRYVPYGDIDTVDGTHASLAGYVVWGDRLAAKVRELFPQ